MTPEMPRPLAVDRLPGELLVEADEAERDLLSRRLRIEAVLSLTCRFRLRRAGAAVLADGALDARVVQSCVVSLEPVEQEVHELFTLRFVPSGEEREDDDPEAPDELPYEGGRIDLGEAAAEQLALALDPYPRRPDAVLEAGGEEDGTANPFAGLAWLKRAQ